MKNYNTLFESIEELTEYVNILPSVDITSIHPFIGSVIRTVIIPITGSYIIDTALTNADMKEQLRRVVAPLAIAAACPELSITFGDNGHTVAGGKERLPASDNKIAAFADACLHRGYMELDAWISNLDVFESGNFLSGPEDLRYLGIKLTPPNVTYYHIYAAASDVADMVLSNILPTRVYDELWEGSTDNCELEPILKLIKKYVLKRSLLRVPSYGIFKAEELDRSQIQDDSNVLEELIKSKVTQMSKENEDGQTYNSFFSCVS